MTNTRDVTTVDIDIRRTFARDASGLELVPDAVARPNDIAEVMELLREATSARTAVTPAGWQSSTTGASITDHGLLLSMRGLAWIGDVDTDTRSMRVGPGAIVADVRRAAEAAGLLFTPDPTSDEESTIGGAIACNASGARSLRYGATRPHVRAMTVLLASGERLDLRRPQLEKNTVGYPIAHDPVDWFVGSEGTLGVVVEAELALHALPVQVLGLMIPFEREHDALTFVVSARRSTAVHPRCLEFFDQGAMDIARMAEGSVGWAPNATAMVYVEETGTDESRPDDELPLEAWLELADAHAALSADIRVYDSATALCDARHLRHAVPATMNERGAARRPFGGRKVSTDWAVPYPRLAEALHIARRFAADAGVTSGIAYGHAGNGHPHQNFIAQDADELHRIECVVEATLREVIAMGGTVAAEHGIGKLKRRWLPMQASPAQLRVMHAIKREFDPLNLLAQGNVL
ncbi:FAD-binding oxidoreductase [Gemmatimonas sp.]|uniref:FAD-binding oxidoreductase n=1 Tax=Gemmatimonas sp. TaxID=1962908 RepID=UPI0039838B64